MIPKIIHQTAPKNKEEWSPIWEECQETWKVNFSGFEYILWDDDDLYNLIRKEYTQYLNYYESLPFNIMKVDFARFCILHQYGGIYADMDIYCYKNFYDRLNNDLYFVESWEEWGEIIQNSLMASIPNHDFWIKCMDVSMKTFKSFPLPIIKCQEDLPYLDQYVLKITGPKLISNCIDFDVSILPKEIFNPQLEKSYTSPSPIIQNFYSKQINEQIKKDNEIFLDYFNFTNTKESDIITRHYLTGNWFKFSSKEINYKM